MKKSIVGIIQNTLPDLFKLISEINKKSFSLDYDKEADVIYLGFDSDRKADDTEVYSDDILLRKRSHELVGVTILHASDYLKEN